MLVFGAQLVDVHLVKSSSSFFFPFPFLFIRYCVVKVLLMILGPLYTRARVESLNVTRFSGV